MYTKSILQQQLDLLEQKQKLYNYSKYLIENYDVQNVYLDINCNMCSINKRKSIEISEEFNSIDDVLQSMNIEDYLYMYNRDGIKYKIISNIN